MFNNINFLTEEILEPITSNSSEYPEDKYTKNSQCVFQGLFMSLDAFPLSDYAKSNYYYMDVFGVIDAGEHYFTSRQNFDSYLILYTYSGKGSLEYHGNKYMLSEGDGFFINCNDPHTYQALSEHWTHSVLHIKGSLIADMYNKYTDNGSVMFSDPINGKYQQLLEQLITCCDSSTLYRDLEASTLICNILTYLILSSAKHMEAKRSIPSIFQKLIKYIDKHYSEALSLDYLATYFGISKYHMSRQFKQYTGFSPHDYIMQKRINQSKFLLTQTILPINQIAESVGMGNICNFNNQFKKRIGITPSEYRKRQWL